MISCLQYYQSVQVHLKVVYSLLLPATYEINGITECICASIVITVINGATMNS